MNPAASIIIPVYNRAHLIERCLESVFKQHYRPLEIIVIDNNSTDSSLLVALRWLEEHPDAQITYKTGVCKIQGASAARSVGQDMASSDILFFFDSDDTMRPDLVKDAMEVFALFPNTDIAGWRVEFHHLNGKTGTSHLWRPYQTLDYHLIHSVLRTQGYAVKRDFLLKSGGWQPGIPVWDDWELGIRLLLQKPDIKVLDKVQADVWAQKESITGTSFSAKAGEWERILDTAERNAIESEHPQSKHIVRLVAYRRAILAAIYKREKRPDLTEPLLKAALASPHLSFLQREAIKFAFAHTAMGLRGAFMLAGPLL